jgi:hypothetical protein
MEKTKTRFTEVYQRTIMATSSFSFSLSLTSQPASSKGTASKSTSLPTCQSLGPDQPQHPYSSIRLSTRFIRYNKQNLVCVEVPSQCPLLCLLLPVSTQGAAVAAGVGSNQCTVAVSTTDGKGLKRVLPAEQSLFYKQHDENCACIVPNFKKMANSFQ